MTTSASTPAPATAMPSEPEKFRVVIPPEVASLLAEGPEDLDALEPAAIPEPSPPAVTPATPAPTPAAPVPAVVPVAAAPPAPASVDTTDAQLKRAEEVWGRVEESVRQARGTRQAVPATSTALSDQEWEKFTAGAKDEIAKAEDFGAAAEEIFKRLREYDKVRAEREATARWTQKLEILQEAARSKYPDFDAMLVEAGLWGEGIPDDNGTIRDRVLAKQIYSDANPPDAAYWVAVGRVAQKQGKSVREFLAERGRPAPAPSPAPAPAPAAPAASPVVVPPTPASPVAAHPGEPAREPAAIEAARRATADTLSTMADHSARPRGLRNLEPAAPPQNLYSFAQLDRLMDRNPDAFLALVDANPGLDQWFMNGGKAVE